MTAELSKAVQQEAAASAADTADPAALSDEAISRFLSGLWQLNRRMMQDAEALLGEHRLELRHFFMLMSIRKGASYPKQLSEQLQIPSTLLSRYIDQLVQLGFLERQIDRQDSRRTVLQVTESGETAVAGAARAIRRYASDRLQVIEPTKRLALLEAMETLGYSQPPAPATAPTKEKTT